MSLYGELITENASWNVDKKYFNDDNSKYYNKIKKDKSWLEKALNRCSEKAFNSFRNKNFVDYVQKDVDEFYKKQKKAPKVKSFELNSDYIEFYYDGNYPSDDIALFYQDEVVKQLNSDDELNSKGYKFKSEDYIAIYIIKCGL